MLGAGNTDATGLREGLETALPRHRCNRLCKIVEAELARVLEVDLLTLDLSALAAADVQGRARAFRALVGNGTAKGIEVAEARRLAGLT